MLPTFSLYVVECTWELNKAQPEVLLVQRSLKYSSGTCCHHLIWLNKLYNIMIRKPPSDFISSRTLSPTLQEIKGTVIVIFCSKSHELEWLVVNAKQNKKWIKKNGNIRAESLMMQCDKLTCWVKLDAWSSHSSDSSTSEPAWFSPHSKQLLADSYQECRVESEYWVRNSYPACAVSSGDGFNLLTNIIYQYTTTERKNVNHNYTRWPLSFC